MMRSGPRVERRAAREPRTACFDAAVRRLLALRPERVRGSDVDDAPSRRDQPRHPGWLASIAAISYFMHRNAR